MAPLNLILPPAGCVLLALGASANASNADLPPLNRAGGPMTCPPSLVSVTGAITGADALANGGQVTQLCAPIGPVGADNFNSFDLFVFEEQQAVELAAPLVVDDTTTLAAGESVSSYYVVWDPAGVARVQATLTFPDTIIGVISDSALLQQSVFMGDASAEYLSPGLLGLEPGDDSFAVDGATLTIDWIAQSPGDTVRVLLGTPSPNFGTTACNGEDVTLLGTVTGGSAASAGGVFEQLCDPIGTIGNNNLQSNNLFAFEEAVGVTLAQDIVVNQPMNGTIAAGTRVNSYYVAYDPATDRDIIGSVTFPAPILGMATQVDTLDASDTLGNPTANYLNPTLRGLEPGDNASFSGATVMVDFSAGTPGDYVRVITEVPDTDSDGISDDQDNCQTSANTDQRDTDGDGFGNVCDADLNNDCIVNVVDLGLLRSVFFSSDADADFNNDGVVNVQDLGILRVGFFQEPGPSAVASCAQN